MVSQPYSCAVAGGGVGDDDKWLVSNKRDVDGFSSFIYIYKYIERNVYEIVWLFV